MKNFEIYRNKYGLGWNVYDMRSTTGKRVYHTPSEEDAYAICNLLNETQNLDLIPFGIKKFEPVCLKVNDEYYLYSTEKEVELSMLLHLSKEVKYNNITLLTADEKNNEYFNKLQERIKTFKHAGIYKIFDYFMKHQYEFIKFSNVPY